MLSALDGLRPPTPNPHSAIQELIQSVLGDKGPLLQIHTKCSRRVKTSYPKPTQRHPGTRTKCSLREMVSHHDLVQSVHEGLGSLTLS